MAAPVVAARASGVSGTTDVTSHPITMPSGITAGDLLLVVFSFDGTPTAAATGWNKIGQASSTTVTSAAVFWKVAVGGDTCTVDLSGTGSLQQSSHISFRITGAGTPTASSASGSSTNSNPPNHVSPRTAEDHLWIAYRSSDVSVGATHNATAAPSGYSNFTTQNATGTNGAASATAEKTTTGDESDDPGTFTSATEQWVAWTIAVPPPDPSVTFVGAGTDSIQVGTTSLTPTLPTGLQNGDLMVMVYANVSWSATPNAPSGGTTGWTLKASTVSSTGWSRLSWYYRRYQSGDTAPTLTYSGTSTDIRVAHIWAFRGLGTSGDATDVLGTASSNAAATNMGPYAGVTTTNTATGLVLVGAVREQDWDSVATLTGESLPWVELTQRTDWELAGDNIGVAVDYALVPSATTISSKTFTVTTGNTGAAVGQMWALKAPVVASDPKSRHFFTFF